MNRPHGWQARSAKMWRNTSKASATSKILGRGPRCFKRGFAATSGWRRRQASDNRFLNMLPIVTGRKIIGGWRKKWCRLRLRGSPRVREYGRSAAGEEFKPFYTVMLV